MCYVKFLSSPMVTQEKHIQFGRLNGISGGGKPHADVAIRGRIAVRSQVGFCPGTARRLQMLFLSLVSILQSGRTALGRTRGDRVHGGWGRKGGLRCRKPVRPKGEKRTVLCQTQQRVTVIGFLLN